VVSFLCPLALADLCIGPRCFIKINSALQCYPTYVIDFYLTKPFGVEAFSIRWYAQVRGHELVTRRDLLPDEPGHPRAEQRYY